MRKLLALILTICCLSGIAGAIQTQAGPYKLDVRTEPAVIPVGKATLIISVTDQAGHAVTGAKIKAIAQMPGMPMGERETQAVADPTHPGTYTMPAQFAMAGGYEAKISIEGPNGTAIANIPMQTGESTGAASSGAVSVGTIALWVTLLVAVVFIVARMRRTGQRIDARPLLKRSVVTSLLILAILIGISVYVVNHFRRPGAMTPVEAQVMEMNMPAPEGSTPVELATVKLMPFGETVHYSGQAAGFVEQQVNPRVTGVIQWMPFYVGDRVRKGQVLARLDTSQLQPEVSSKQAAVANARQGVNVARSDYQQAQAMVGQAEAELDQYKGAIEEATAEVSAASEERQSALSNVGAARADVADAQSRVNSAEADRTYWREELSRMQTLLAANAVSKSEFQKEQAEAAKAEASVRQANEAVLNMQAKLRAAQAQVRKSDAGITAARKKVSQATSQLMAHHAHVKTEQAATRSSLEKISQAETAVRGAEADLSGAAAMRGYSEVRSEVDGVITDRLISPGVLVSPGQTILKVAQISPIRLQANVSESDLARVKVGNLVQVRRQDTGPSSITARVTSVSPSVDPSSRTGIVEVLLGNRDGSFMPGQFVSMDISVGSKSERVVVPSSAVQTAVTTSASGMNSTESQSYVWVAQPVQDQPGQYTAKRVGIQVSDQAGDMVAIRSGLSAGDQVVINGATYLTDGQMVSATPPSAGAAESQTSQTSTIRVTDKGFEPNSISLASGVPRKVTFLRTTNQTCATEVVFASIKLRKSLPLNVPVTIDLPASASGKISYACGMNMFRGEVVIQ